MNILNVLCIHRVVVEVFRGFRGLSKQSFTNLKSVVVFGGLFELNSIEF